MDDIGRYVRNCYKCEVPTDDKQMVIIDVCYDCRPAFDAIFYPVTSYEATGPGTCEFCGKHIGADMVRGRVASYTMCLAMFCICKDHLEDYAIDVQKVINREISTVFEVCEEEEAVAV